MGKFPWIASVKTRKKRGLNIKGRTFRDAYRFTLSLFEGGGKKSCYGNVKELVIPVSIRKILILFVSAFLQVFNRVIYILWHSGLNQRWSEGLI